MVAINATDSATPSLQSVLGAARVTQARREADRAQANARNLRRRRTGLKLKPGKARAAGAT